MRLILFCLIGCMLDSSTYAEPKNLSELLEQVKKDQIEDSRINKKREQEFLRDKDKQATLLKTAKENLLREKKRGDQLKLKFDQQEKQLAQLEEQLKLTMGTLGELFGIVRQVAGDTKGVFENSIVSAEYPERVLFVDNLSRRKELPETKDLEKLWVELLTQMTESGKVSRFSHDVVSVSGQKSKQDVTRIGVFNLLSSGRYLKYNSENQTIIELARQPQGRFLSMLEEYEDSHGSQLVAIGLDPSRGTILDALGQAPSLLERFQQGKEVGYVIFIVLVVGLGISTERFIYLTRLRQLINKQLSEKSFDPANPLGLIFETYQKYKTLGVENLELKLDEAIIKGSNKVERGLSTIKILASIAPLLGLLGTVTGMIGTFQSMMLFGTGDPKIMAGGISQALVTTVLGLLAAIPLILLHSFISGQSKTILSILEEQSIGLIASRVEEEA